MSKIQATFDRLRAVGQVGLIAFTTVGHPDIESNLKAVPAMVSAGVDIVELGIPFSDPLADGATIQASSFHALKQGVNLGSTLEIAKALRKSCPETPLVLMGYYNPIFSFGLSAFAKKAKEAGVDGIIVPDLPPEEAGPLNSSLVQEGIDLICMLAPTSPPERIRKVAAMSSGFIYCVSLTGVTGARSELPRGLPQFILRVRQETTLPLAVGFGISKGAQVKAIGRYADAAVVGSAIVDLLDKTPPNRTEVELREFIGQLRSG